ncbi:MAG: DUF790 family protein [Candidatus Nitrosocaldus sp.]
MLPTSLVRARVRKGRLIPIFASQEDIGLASLMIDELDRAYESRERKGSLLDRVRALEDYNDYRLVRGFYTILERRCVFKHRDSPVHPTMLRMEVFKESSRRGYALTHGERKSIMEEVASRLKVDPSYMEEMMWSDMDENLIIEEFRSISPESLVAEYNIALLQSILLNCTRLECSVLQGVEWKNLLRQAKRLGLMYMLDDSYRYKDEDDDDNNDIPSSVICIIDGPASIFKLTDRYGFAIARLLPTLLRSKGWWMKAWIVRKGMGRGVDAKRLYELKISSKDAMKIDLLLHSSSSEWDGNRDEDDGYSVYDSSVEERFATLFNQYGTGWRLVREPEPIAVSGQAFIPDFVLEKYGRRIYIEIVGFWTKDYIERKVKKLMQIKSKGMYKDSDMILLVNKELVCSEPIHMEHLSKVARIIAYDGKNIPMKQIIAHLKSIEDEITAEHVSDDILMKGVKAYIKGLNHGRIISIKEMAERFNITYDAALSIITSIVQNGELPNHEMVMNAFLIPRDMLEDIRRKVWMHKRLVDACKVLEAYGVPEEYHTSLLSILGYTVVWKDIDVNNAVIVRKYYEEDEDGLR